MKIVRIKSGIAPPLKNKGIEVVVQEDFRRGDDWNTIPYSRYFLLRDGRQIDGFDIDSARFKKSDLNRLLKRNRLTSKGVTIYVK